MIVLRGMPYEMVMPIYQIFKGNKFPCIALTAKAHIGKILQSCYCFTAWYIALKQAFWYKTRACT